MVWRFKECLTLKRYLCSKISALVEWFFMWPDEMPLLAESARALRATIWMGTRNETDHGPN
eukprot:maker-scaffold85_size395806-snap-gene-2.30 protein:Tk03923 transcript:maker-scaffold85_size395806-snap-gene-2.30-mRNA-1 annotation:"---NA---"